MSVFLGQSVSRKIATGVISGFGLTAATIFAVLVQYRLAVDFLPTDLVGIWMLFLTFSAYVSFMDLGFSPTLSREIGFVLGRGSTIEHKHQEIANLLRTGFRIFQVLALIVFFLGFFGGLAFLLSISSIEIHDQVTFAWLVFMVGAVVNIIGAASFASLFGLGDVSTERVVRAVFQLLWLVISYLALKFGYGLVGLASAWVVQNLLARIVAIILLYKRYPWLRAKKGKASLDIFKRIVGPSMRWAITGFGAILILQSSNIIIAAKMGPSSIPPYEAVSRIVMTMMTLSIFIVTSSTPFISTAYSAGNHNLVVGLIMRNVRFSMATISILAAFLAVYCDQVIFIWLGPESFPGWAVVWTLLIMVVLETHHVTLAGATMATGRVVFARSAILAGILNIAIAIFLIDHLGLWGIALGVMLAQLVTNNWYVPYVAFNAFNLSQEDYFKKVFISIFVLFILSVGVNTLSRQLIDSGQFIGLSISFILAMLFGGALFFSMVLNSSERQALTKFLQPLIIKF